MPKQFSDKVDDELNARLATQRTSAHIRASLVKARADLMYLRESARQANMPDTSYMVGQAVSALTMAINSSEDENTDSEN